MPRRPCSICLRQDVDELDQKLKDGMSVRQIAIRNGMHPRVLLEHYRAHRNGIAHAIRRGRRGAQALARATEAINVLTEAKTLYHRAVKYLDTAANADSQRDMQRWIAETRECLKLLGNASGELQSGQNVTVAVGVSVERAREAVTLVEEAQALTDAELADRAMRMLEAYNAANPNDMRTLGAPRSFAVAGGDGAGTPGT